MEHSCEADNKYPWSYHGTDNGPSNWGKSYPACEKEFQSPMELKNELADDSIFKAIEFEGFDQPVTKATVQNMGWTVMITLGDDVQRAMKWMNRTFDLRNIHFHFGTESDPGAENVINGVRHTMEIQYYVYQKELDVKVILSTFMDVDDDNYSALDPITEVLSEVMYRNDSTELKSDLYLSNLLPKISSVEDYYFLYDGFKAIPPCVPVYLWVIYKDVGKVGKDQLDTFNALYSVEKDDASDDCLMGPNYRPLQKRDNRIMFTAPYYS
ncbi:unnamed protein product [Larinioides sclopetarius]|uniref:carbonic anhydrase n=1 Tax=Larinioides sclopetarius TaxID=280406 RepID=A0AAV2C2G7_9ARAC